MQPGTRRHPAGERTTALDRHHLGSRPVDDAYGERATRVEAGHSITRAGGEDDRAWVDMHPRPGPKDRTVAWAAFIPVRNPRGKGSLRKETFHL